MSLFSLFVAFLVLLAVGGLWFVLYYINNPVLKEPDGLAKVVGNCGDTMEIGLAIRDGRVAKTHSWTNGCSFSKQCVEAAVMIAHGKSVEELDRVNMVTIMEHVGQLPDTHLHCAQLAEITLKKSVDNYREKAARQSDR